MQQNLSTQSPCVRAATSVCTADATAPFNSVAEGGAAVDPLSLCGMPLVSVVAMLVDRRVPNASSEFSRALTCSSVPGSCAGKTKPNLRATDHQMVDVSEDHGVTDAKERVAGA